jgi:undecaprenyl-diphosphatase
MANFLNTFFAGIDGSMFSFVNNMAKNGGAFFTPFFEFVTIFCEKGWFFIALGLILALFSKHRKAGFCILLAVAFGGLFTNIILKKMVARPRPYTVEEFRVFWEFVGAHKESEYSFPSGHTTSAFAGALAFFIMKDKKFSWLMLVFASFIAFSRIYLVVHYTSDIFGGIISGSLAAVCSYAVTKLLFNYIDKKSEDCKFFKFVKEFDIVEFFKKPKKEQK